MANNEELTSSQHIKEGFIGFNNKTSDTVARSTTRGNEHHLDHELNQRIDAMLKRLTVDQLTPDMESAASVRSHHDDLKSLSPEIPSGLLNSDVKPQAPTQVIEQQTSRQDSGAIVNKHNRLNGGREAPSWLNEMEDRLSQRVPNNKSNPEPVINVTIGRVEVRAVQAETPKHANDKKKPTGVMSLGDYLKQRERGRPV
jgi:hypothetical protein